MRICTLLVFFLLLATIGYGSDSETGNANNANNTNNTNNANNANSQNNLNNVDCIRAQNDVASAIRDLPRECINDSDCITVERAANCECTNAVSFRSDLTEFEEALTR